MLMEANGRLTRRLGAALEASSGLALSAYDAMVRIRRSEAGRLTMGELANQIVLTSGGVTRLVDRLEAAGLVERLHCPEDRRTTYLALTDVGNDRLEAATVAHLAHLDEFLVAPTTEAERNGLRIGLQRLIDAGPNRAC
jgi:DNA-binding MarR family transcriptional regulator